MSPRQTYQVNNREKSKTAQRDQSFRNCVVTLLIFFFLCLILILACVFWKMRSQREDKDGTIEHESQHHRGEHAEGTTTAPTTGTIPPEVRTPPTSTRTASIAEDTSTEGTDYVAKSAWRNVKGSRMFERLSENRTTEGETVTSPAIASKEDTFEDYVTATREISRLTEIEEKSHAITGENVASTASSRRPDVSIVDVVDVGDDTTSTSPTGPIVSTATLSYTVSDVESVYVTNSKFVEVATDEYRSSEESRSNETTDNIATSSAPSADLEGNATGNSIDEHGTSKADNITLSTEVEEHAVENPTSEYDGSEITAIDNVTSSSSTSAGLPIDLEGSTDAGQSDDYYYIEKAQSDVITTSIQSATEEAEESIKIYPTYEESTNVTHDAKLIDNEYPTEVNVSVAESSVSPPIEESSATTEIINEAGNTMNAATSQAEAAGKEDNETAVTATHGYGVFSTENYTSVRLGASTAIALTVSRNEAVSETAARALSDEDAKTCEEGHCKQIASKMLSYMNHSADPCEDFYEYACGGFEADPQLIDRQLVRRSRNYERIARQMLKEKRENTYSTFAKYYDSCVQYERTMNFSERIKMANDALRKVGEFFTNATWPDNYGQGFTLLFARLMLHHSPFLFDIVPELDEYRKNSFTLKIGPSTYESPFKTEYADDPCSEDEFETKGRYVNLGLSYDNYKRCKNDTKEFMKSVKEALTALKVFKGLNDSHLEWSIESEYIENTINVINSVIMQGYFSRFPSKSEIREAYLMKKYDQVSLKKLQDNSLFINWTLLIRSLTGVNVLTDEALQVYFYTTLIEGLLTLEKFSKKDPMSLNNAIMGLYAYKLYNELVLSRHNNNMKDHCLQVATYLLRLEASSLYISSFSDQEIMQMDAMINDTFDKLRRTLKLKTEEAQWAREEGLQGLLNKIDSLELTLPVVSYFKNRDSLYNEYNVSQIILYDNYFNNSIILLRRYRTLMYAELRRQVGNPKQIWTYYATPFQSKAQSIYGLNLVVIPYGVVDLSLINDDFTLDYILLATLGNSIAHQIAHHFDANGIHYWNQVRNTQDSFMYENEFTDTNFDDYISCQKENLYQAPMNMTLPFTDQTVSFMIPQLTLNERLSETMGLRLAYDTLAITRSDAEERLPWMKLRIDQLFYLAYAQMYCTKSPLTSSYVSLYESEDLPSRIRVFVSASNNKLLAEAWQCPIGSQIAPNDICSVFPYIESKETIMIPE